MGMEKKNKKKAEKSEVGEGIEELLIRLRTEKGWSRVELMSKLPNKTIKEKDIRKWEIGLEYPDLDMIYDLSEIYQIPSEKFVEAKNNSFVKGLGSVNMILTKWICYFLNVSIKVGMVLLVLFYAIMLFLAFGAFTFIGAQVNKSLI